MKEYKGFIQLIREGKPKKYKGKTEVFTNKDLDTIANLLNKNNK